MKRLLPEIMAKAGAYECSHCDEGWRHPVGNCVICGWGPAPMKQEPLPATDSQGEKTFALKILAHQMEHERGYFEVQQAEFQRRTAHLVK